MAPDTKATLVQRYFAATRTMNVDAWLVCFADDAVSHDPYGAPPIQGKAGLRQFFLKVAKAFAEIGFTEDYVAVTEIVPLSNSRCAGSAQTAGR